MDLSQTVYYETAQNLAKQRNLDPNKLHVALNQYMALGNTTPGAADGSAWTVKNGKIWWIDRADPGRFILEDFYKQA